MTWLVHRSYTTTTRLVRGQVITYDPPVTVAIPADRFENRRDAERFAEAARRDHRWATDTCDTWDVTGPHPETGGDQGHPNPPVAAAGIAAARLALRSTP